MCAIPPCSPDATFLVSGSIPHAIHLSIGHPRSCKMNTGDADPDAESSILSPLEFILLLNGVFTATGSSLTLAALQVCLSLSHLLSLLSLSSVINCTCCYDEIKGIQDQNLSCSFSDSLSHLLSSLTHILTHLLSLVLVVMMRSKELKTSRYILMLILGFSLSCDVVMMRLAEFKTCSHADFLILSHTGKK